MEAKDRSVDRTYPSGKVNLTRLTFEWAIEDFSIVDTHTEKLESSVFVVGAEAEYQFKFKLYNGCYDEYTKDFVSLYLQPLTHLPFRAHLMFYVLNNRGEKVEVHDSCGVVVLTKSIKWGFRCFLRRSHLRSGQSGLLTRDALRIFCELICDDSYNAALPSVTPLVPHALARLQTLSQYEQLLTSGEFSDVKFTSADGQVFHAHRSVLAAGSPVFAKMFQNGHEDVELALETENAEVLREMLLFIYVGKVNHLDRLAKDLLIIAHAYGLDGLKKMCARSLCAALTVENAIESLTLAHRLGEEMLKARSIEFIVAHGREIVQKPEFQMIAALDTDIVIDMFRVLLSRN